MPRSSRHHLRRLTVLSYPIPQDECTTEDPVLSTVPLR
ncbi:hypothetical protein LINPERHAP1_LOCUS27993 [Linum perenne]